MKRESSCLTVKKMTGKAGARNPCGSILFSCFTRHGEYYWWNDGPAQFGYRVSMRRLLEVQARLLARYLCGEIDQYPHYLVR
jgi:hypothetical protein